MEELLNSTEVIADESRSIAVADFSSFISYRCRLILRMCSTSSCLLMKFCCGSSTQCGAKNVTCCLAHQHRFMSTDQVTSHPDYSDADTFDENVELVYYGISLMLFLFLIVILYQCFKTACSSSTTVQRVPTQSSTETVVATGREPLTESSVRFEAPQPSYRYERVRIELLSKLEDPPPPYVEVLGRNY